MLLASFLVMPSAEEILHGLHTIANAAIAVSIGWHVALGVAVVAILAGARLTNRSLAAVLSAPLASVSLLAFAFENPFNGAVFALLAVGLAGLAMRASPGSVALGRPWAIALGGLSLAFAWIYPHFLEGADWFVYLYAAPLGAIPCPTLSAVIGIALIADGFGLGAWRLPLAAAALFYSLFGVLRLGVVIDAVLFAGALGLVVQYLQERVNPSSLPVTRTS
jgi:hypothetical protein